MNYKIKIENAFEEEGKVDLRRLTDIAEGILHIAEGALQIRLTGISFSKGRKASYLNDALAIKLSGIHKGSTVIDLECEPFEKTIDKVQYDLFKQDIYKELLNDTPVSLVIKSFNNALDENAPKDFLDKSLLLELKQFDNVFRSSEETIFFLNQGTISELQLQKNDFSKIEILEKETPDPQHIILNGKIDVLEYSKTRAKIITKEGLVEAILGNQIKPEEIRNYWGEEVTIVGTAYYKPGGNISFILIEKIFEPGSGDEYFSFKPHSESVEQQISNQIKEKYKQGNPLKDIVGKWPGEESDEEFEQLLKEID